MEGKPIGKYRVARPRIGYNDRNIYKAYAETTPYLTIQFIERINNDTEKKNEGKKMKNKKRRQIKYLTGNNEDSPGNILSTAIFNFIRNFSFIPSIPIFLSLLSG